MWRLLLVILVWAGAWGSTPAQEAVPTLLIVQLRQPFKEEESDPNVSAVDYLAQALDEDGRVFPIAWSLSDPIFRIAVDEGRIQTQPNPTLNQIMGAMRPLRARYLLAVQVFREEQGALRVSARLFDGRRQIWADGMDSPQRVLAAIGNETNEDVALRSQARTWVTMLAEGPLRGLPARRRQQTPAPDPGTQPTLPETPTPEPPKVDNRDVLVQVMKLLSENKADEAVSVLRLAVDAEPLDVERRRVLINTLLRTGHRDLGCDEARRAAQLFPDASDLWLLAARASMEAGDLAQAQADLNEAVVRDPDSAFTRQLLGELQLAKSEPESALPHLDRAIELGPSPGLHVVRAVARALAADPAGSAADLQTLTPEAIDESGLEWYGTAVLFGDAWAQSLAEELRDLIPRLRSRPEAAQRTRVAGMRARLGGLLDVLERLHRPGKHDTSHARRVLALKLLTQTVVELEAHLRSPSEDAVAEATLNLGEAMQALKMARESYQAERAQP